MRDDYVIPRLRQDLNYDIYEENNERFIVLFDPKGYAQQPAAFPQSILPLLQIIDGKITKAELEKFIKSEVEEDISLVLQPFLNFIDNLDQMGYLESTKFFAKKFDIDNYLISSVRPPVCAGNSYPEKPDELKEYVDSMDSWNKNDFTTDETKAIIVPHIDFRIGEGSHKAYSAGYQMLRNTEADIFIILGTSHYGSSDFFMFTEKDYSTPLGVVKTDKELLNRYYKKVQFKPTIDDMAHRYEHSIELQTVWLQHLMKDRKFTVLPILIGSFHEFVNSRTLPSANEKFNDFIDNINLVIEESGRKAVFIASVDFAHIGRKFGDEFDAEPELEKLKDEDGVLIKHLLNCNADGFFNEVSSVDDRRKICGLSPIYTMLKAVNPRNSQFLHYHQWNEIEALSAVSFASMAFY